MLIKNENSRLKDLSRYIAESVPHLHVGSLGGGGVPCTAQLV